MGFWRLQPVVTRARTAQFHVSLSRTFSRSMRDSYLARPTPGFQHACVSSQIAADASYFYLFS